MEENNAATEPVVITEPNTATNPVEPSKEPEKVVSKELFDKLATELATKKKELKSLQDAGKSAEQLKSDELALIDNELKQSRAELNEVKAISITEKAKASIGLDEKNTEFDTVLKAITASDIEVTKSQATAFSKLLSAVYEKGLSDAKKEGINKMSEGILSGGISDKSTPTSAGKYAKRNTIGEKTDVFTNIGKIN